jgi:hypothetical protein
MDNNEFTLQWQDLKESDKETIVDSLSQAFGIPKKKAATLKRIFDLGKPGIVMGERDKKAYCRLEESSREVITVLMKNYL